MGPSGLESVRCWGRGRAGVPRKMKLHISPRWGLWERKPSSSVKPPLLNWFMSGPRSSIAAPQGPVGILPPARLLRDRLNLCSRALLFPSTAASPSALLPLSQGQGELRPEIILCQACLFEI